MPKQKGAGVINIHLIQGPAIVHVGSLAWLSSILLKSRGGTENINNGSIPLNCEALDWIYGKYK